VRRNKGVDIGGGFICTADVDDPKKTCAFVKLDKHGLCSYLGSAFSSLKDRVITRECTSSDAVEALRKKERDEIAIIKALDDI